MRNKVNYIHVINFINYFTHETKETIEIRQNPEKWGCDSFQQIFMAVF